MSAHSPNEDRSIETIAVLALVANMAALLFAMQSLFIVATVLLAMGLCCKGLRTLLSDAWMKIAVAVGTFNAKLLLGIFFGLVLTPLSFMYRMFNKDALNVRNVARERGAWHERNHTYAPLDMENMW